MTEEPILDAIAVLAKPTQRRTVCAKAFRQRNEEADRHWHSAHTTGRLNVPCKVVAKTGSFPLINKAMGISSDTGTIQRPVSMNNYELASAAGSQATLANAKFRVIGNPVTQVDAQKGLPPPIAIAHANNRDPAVEWSTSSSRSFTLHLSHTQVSLSATGPGSAATAYFAMGAGVIDGITDITRPESAATRILDLILPFNEIHSFTPTINLAAFDLASAGPMSNNLGDTGLTNDDSIREALHNHGWASGKQSVLFVDQQSFADERFPPPSPQLCCCSDRRCWAWADSCGCSDCKRVRRRLIWPKAEIVSHRGSSTSSCP